MNINKKQQIIELLKTLIEGITYIKRNIDKDYTFMSEISLEAINSIINQLNNFKSNDERIVNLTKEVLCSIMKIHNNYSNQNIDICEKTISNLNKIIELIEVNMDKKLNIVFMPYNASMWNSLESIWKSASKDDRCNCYVVPIPYYKIISSSDGNDEFIFTYEGDKFPEYVPVTDYKKFSLEKIRPDIIYIHNQYDEFNNATRVDSDYFSYNLKKYTDMLVYVTYGILGTYPVGFYTDFYSFISTRDFDKVIVQSPSFEVIAEFSGIPKNKILTLGSPKFDALVANLEKNSIDQNLKKQLENKIVFLWTTNLMKIINGRNEVIDQIEEVFNLIENNNEYALIYRPHPLELEYVKSKAPECFDRYNDLLESLAYKSNIILDNTSSYYEAFNISDALITDRSSVLIEYMKTGKPVFIYDIGLERKYYDSRVFDIFANYLVGEDGMDVEKFIDIVKYKKDDKLQLRLDALKDVIVNDDGSCGYKIHSSIVQEFISDYF